MLDSGAIVHYEKYRCAVPTSLDESSSVKVAYFFLVVFSLKESAKTAEEWKAVEQERRLTQAVKEAATLSYDKNVLIKDN
ncbi:hypothetical protein G6F57_000617 [Rhizopus arrhizus]|nr:hypothetical protein G6F24_000714 [Rhizopus arrhizus]KAG1420254.1 hypothetical protein G6F58_004265 [Rhizopus delemar]KAG0797313.1 hypothetical protein G6F21_000629 [Rhizopus arrhizus]KAG0800079.1 hypothetical protein G6F22_002592 [Rhizopus arrhizus]KAG0819137.1 hypothetical protein G6F20_000993 [Rhizopus arrhizus]